MSFLDRFLSLFRRRIRHPSQAGPVGPFEESEMVRLHNEERARHGNPGPLRADALLSSIAARRAATAARGERMIERDVRDKPLSERLPEALFMRIHEDIGKAATCWDPIPEGVFDAATAGILAFNLCHAVADAIDEARNGGQA